MAWFNNMKIGIRIGIGFGVVLVLTILVGGLGITRSGDINRVVDDLTNNMAQDQQLSAGMVEQILFARFPRQQVHHFRKHGRPGPIPGGVRQAGIAAGGSRQGNRRYKTAGNPGTDQPGGACLWRRSRRSIPDYGEQTAICQPDSGRARSRGGEIAPRAARQCFCRR